MQRTSVSIDTTNSGAASASAAPALAPLLASPITPHSPAARAATSAAARSSTTEDELLFHRTAVPGIVAAAPSRAAADEDGDLDTRLKRQKLYVALPIVDGGLGYNDKTRALLADIGGFDALLAMTSTFYGYFWQDAYLKQFLGALHTPLAMHARRLAMYIAEMMGQPDEPWTADTARRAGCPHENKAPLANNRSVVVDSRFNAHHAAWHSVTRPADRVGRRFKLDDCRVWMRLMFWACRTVGLAQHEPFFSYFQRWIGHFIPVYETTARVFARAEARWSAKEENIEAYVAAGRVMRDVLDVSYSRALASIPRSEASDDEWPYR